MTEIMTAKGTRKKANMTDLRKNADELNSVMEKLAMNVAVQEQRLKHANTQLLAQDQLLLNCTLNIQAMQDYLIDKKVLNEDEYKLVAEKRYADFKKEQEAYIADQKKLQEEKKKEIDMSDTGITEEQQQTTLDKVHQFEAEAAAKEYAESKEAPAKEEEDV